MITSGADGRPGPVELRRADAASLRRVVVAVAVACGLTVVRLEATGGEAWRVVAVWTGVLAVVAALPLSRGSLRLDPEGFSVKGVGRRTHHRWTDVHGIATSREWGHTFAVVRLQRGDGDRLMRLESFGLPEEQLVGLMETYRARALAATGGRGPSGPT